MNEHESLAMWKVYSSSNDAICLKTGYQKLAGALPEECFLGKISYLDYRDSSITDSNLFAPLLCKRRSFSYEREVRAIIWDAEGMHSGGNLPYLRYAAVDLNEFVDKILVSPSAADWLVDVIHGLCEKYDITVPIEHSEMNAQPLF